MPSPSLLTPGKGRPLSARPNAKTAILSIGAIGEEALSACESLERKGVPVDHYDMIWLKPLDNELLSEIASRYDLLVTIEDGAVNGGFGSAVSQWLESRRAENPQLPAPKLLTIGIPDKWIAQGSVPELRHLAGIDADTIVSEIIRHI